MTKRLLTLNASADFATALEGEGMAQSLNFTTEDTKEAVKAFLEKRPPTCTSR
ncbi:enoyl-CoA hydratase/isomerase family protein [Candidatus Poriferisodalis sp.]|uniref:enoyl-CoA hydratase/isomerase family protein n=1 Tax=Candidatus Poriferisodalis sp. TaxID=3101277 RepID=UPI003C6F312F